LPPLSACSPVYIDFGLRRFKVALQVPADQAAARGRLRRALERLAAPERGVVDLVDDPRQADWLVRFDRGQAQLVEASANRAPFSLPDPGSADLGEALRRSLEKVYRARNLIALAARFEGERERGSPEVDVEVEVLRHWDDSASGEALPPGERLLRQGELVSFRVHNRSPKLWVDLTLLVVGTDFQIHAFYPRPEDPGKSLKPGGELTLPPPPQPPGKVGPPFGPECLVVIAAAATVPPADFTILAQGGLRGTRGEGREPVQSSPLGELLEFALLRSGTRGGLSAPEAARYGIRALTWRTEP
jgi:hypothetical protein